MAIRRWVSLGILLLVVMAGALLLSLGGEARPPDVTPGRSQAVRSSPPLSGSTIVPILPFVGVVLPRNAVDVTARTEGQIRELPISPGTRVARGAVMAVLDTSTLASAELKIAEVELAAVLADVKRLNIELAHATARRQRMQSLAARQMVPAQDLEDAVYQQELAAARIASAESSVAQRRAVLDQRRTLLDSARISAPFSGVVSICYVERGATVNRGTPIARLVESGRLKVRFAARGDDADRLRPGMRIIVEVPEIGARFAAIIDAIAPEIDSASQMLLVYGTLDGAGDGESRVQALAGRAVRVMVAESSK